MMEVPTHAAPQIPLLSSEEQIRPVRLQKKTISSNIPRTVSNSISILMQNLS